MKYPIVVLALLLLTVSASYLVSAANRISFLSDRDPPVFSIFVMNADGSNPINMSKKLGMELEGIFFYSPDKTKILFDSQRTGNFEIFVINADGSNPVNLTNLPGSDNYPVWSPDGTKILWERGRNIFVMNADGSDKRDLGPGRFPQWSPGGTRIGVNDEGWKSWIMKADGTEWHELSELLRPQPGADTAFLCWSPDGTMFVFSAAYERPWPPRTLLYVINVDGSGLVEIANKKDDYGYDYASWSPDGTKIAFHDGDIFVVNVDGTNLVNLTGHHDFRGAFPKWSSDGEKILYSANGDIYIMNADGFNPVNLTNHPAIDFHANWFDAPPMSISPQDKLVTPWGKIKNRNQ